MSDLPPSASGRHGADDQLIALLAGGATNADAAKSAGISERTVYRRMQDPAFRQRVTEARASLIERAVAQLAASASQAVSTLTDLLGFEYPPAQRVSAARSILELGVKLRESVELEQRIAALEEAKR